MAHATGTLRSIYAPSFDYDCLMPDSDAPRLIHLSKERPKLRKTHFAKRPVIACETLLADDAVDEDTVPIQLSSPPADKLPQYVVVIRAFRCTKWLK